MRESERQTNRHRHRERHRGFLGFNIPSNAKGHLRTERERETKRGAGRREMVLQ